MNVLYHLLKLFVDIFFSGLNDLIIAAFGAFLGFLGALLLNKIITKSNEKKVFKAKLVYIKSLIESIIDVSKRQNLAFIDLASITEKEPLEFHLYKKIASFNLQRLKGYDSDSMLSTYLHFFKESKDCYSNYKRIFKSADFLYSVYYQLDSKSEKHIDYIVRDQVFVRDSVEEIGFKLGIRCENIQEDNAEHRYLKRFFEIFSSFSKRTSILQKVKDEFLIPLNKTIINNVSDKNFANDIVYIIKRALSRLNNIEINSQRFSEEIKLIVNETNESLEKLEQEMKRIDKKISNNI